MNEVVSPLGIEIKTVKLKEEFSGIKNLDRALDGYKKGKVSFLGFASFGSVISSALADNNRFEDYKVFVGIFNRLLNDHFKESLELVSQVYTELSSYEGFQVILRKPYFQIEDKTNIFTKREFKREADLERILYESLINWDDGWSVKKQRYVGKGLSDITVLRQKEKIAIELKKGKALRKDIYRTVEYTAGESEYKGVLIASEFDEEVIELANKLKVNCYEYQLAYPVDGVLPESIYLESVNEAREKTIIELDIENANYVGGHLIDYIGIPESTKSEREHERKENQLFADIKKTAFLIEEKRGRAESKQCPHCMNEIN